MDFTYIDIHSHVNFAAYDADREEVMLRAKENNIAMINVGTQRRTSKKAVEMTEVYENNFSIIGLHPVHANKSFHDDNELGEGIKCMTTAGEEFDKDFYRQLAKNKKVVGIGECGLDFFRLPETNIEEYKFRQVTAFEKQIELAVELDLPLMIHCRSAYSEVLSILEAKKKEYKDGLRGNMHFFAGTVKDAQRCFALDFSISFTGVITFARDYDEVIRFAPLDQIHGETDAPYVAPVPYRGKRNEPSYVTEVIKKIAEIKGQTEEKVASALLQNAIAKFNLV